MKGGTCLRLCFDLPRLSEDLDFDIEDYEKFDLDEFTKDIKNHFSKVLRYPKVETKIAGNKKTVYLKFPVLRELGFTVGKSETNIVHVRIDLSSVPMALIKKEISVRSTSSFSFIIQRYPPSLLFAGKLCAILTRETIEGKRKMERFKGRDYFDLIWFMEKKIIPDWEYVKTISGYTKNQAMEKLKEKADKVTIPFLKNDLLPFFENSYFVENFAKNFQVLFREHNKILEN